MPSVQEMIWNSSTLAYPSFGNRARRWRCVCLEKPQTRLLIHGLWSDASDFFVWKNCHVAVKSLDLFRVIFLIFYHGNSIRFFYWGNVFTFCNQLDLNQSIRTYPKREVRGVDFFVLFFHGWWCVAWFENWFCWNTFGCGPWERVICHSSVRRDSSPNWSHVFWMPGSVRVRFPLLKCILVGYLNPGNLPTKYPQIGNG